MMGKKLQLRLAKQRFIVLAIVDIFIISLVKYNSTNIEGLVFLNLCAIITGITHIINELLNGFELFNFRNLLHVMSLGGIIMLSLLTPRSILNKYSLVILLLFFSVIANMLEKDESLEKKDLNSRMGINKDYNVNSINIFWRYNLKKGEKYNEKVLENFKERRKFERVLYGAFIILILIDFMPLTLFYIVIAILGSAIILKSPIAYNIDKKFKNYYKLDGVCIDKVEVRVKRAEPYYIVSIVDFNKKIEKIVIVNEEDIHRFKIGKKKTLVYGGISKKIVMCN